MAYNQKQGQAMVDLHCHILPGIDDGAKQLSDSLAMARMAVQQGITHILCTPHHNNQVYDNPANQVIENVKKLQDELERQNIPLLLYEGQEVRISGTLLEMIESKELLFADLNNRYLLVELPTNEVPAYTMPLFQRLIERGYIPILVHPERNSKLIEEPNKLVPFLEMGVLTQLTAPSYVGVFGKKIQQTAKQMVANNLVYMMASDAHNTANRGFFMKKAYQEMAKDVGQDQVEAMQQMARDILNGDQVERPDFQAIKRQKFSLF